MLTIDDALEAFLKLGLSCLFGGIIGFERKTAGKPAGLRTNMLICLGSTLIMMLSMHLSTAVAISLASKGVEINKIVGDPARLAAQVVSGVGFLGAGAIMQSKGSGLVIGLTTAATIWTNAAIGLAVGAGYYIYSSIATLFVIVILYLVRIVETKTNTRHPRHRTLFIILKKVKKISQLKKEIYKKGIFIDSESIKKRMDEVEYRADIIISPIMEESLLNQLNDDEQILYFNITNTQ